MLTWLETCRRVYNYAVRERKDWHNSRKCRVNTCSLQQRVHHLSRHSLSQLLRQKKGAH
ncbi:helix-turn-helix domain-containing protein [Phormidium yuhuli AB48]|uniref:Helix-turn-helix domain-containing protein n=1 Tax=Phormidium yuhuli AB48 TaxID=2940671 RepID=A0ABY5AXU6_9CYAN|nr:helix-turn-helix domain-containing protein [Phormidium yuhuli]USR93131.1 helix-turn-helix domain-containing protein [Phormidium yuhuli AB48]